MNRILINICLLFFVYSSHGQETSKKTIYIGYNYKQLCPKIDKQISKEHNGTIFNLNCIKEVTSNNLIDLESINCDLDSNYISVLYTSKADTLEINKIKNYKILNLEDVKKLETEGRGKILNYYKRKNITNHRPITKNDIFKTYLIEIINEKQFVIYPVKWKNPFGYDDYK